MTGTITYILSRAGYRAMNGPLADERRRMAGAEPPAAYVSYDPRLLAGAGWYGYRIVIKGGDRQMLERARYMISERYVIRDGYEYYADGVYVFGVLLRQRVKLYGIGGGAEPEPPTVDFWGLKLTMPEGGTVILRKNGSPNAVSLEVSTDGVNWQPWTLVGTDYSYTLEAGQTLCIRNTSTTFVRLSNSTSNYYQFIFDNTTEASGSVMSLSVNDDTVITLSGQFYNFINLFKGCTNLTSAPSLPATTLSDGCYESMFQGCTNLTSAPSLPATTLSNGCYESMFKGCTSLVNAPNLLATTLASSCYSSMFRGCTSLVNAPNLLATTLASSCYNRMFLGCTSLVNAPILSATTLANYCCYAMFQGCTSLVSAPNLLATTLKNSCYSYMFDFCRMLSEIRTNMKDISASQCLYSWLSAVSPAGDLYCPAELTIPTGISGIPTGWTRHDI